MANITPIHNHANTTNTTNTTHATHTAVVPANANLSRAARYISSNYPVASLTLTNVNVPKLYARVAKTITVTVKNNNEPDFAFRVRAVYQLQSIDSISSKNHLNRCGHGYHTMITAVCSYRFVGLGKA